MNIPFSPPDITDVEIEEVIAALKSGWITTGPKTKEFERQITEYCGSAKTVCLSAATTALEMTLRVLGIGQGDEVIVPAYTYTASCSVICHVGATPVMIDSQTDREEMDYSKMAEAITEKTKAILPVHIFGAPADMDKINEIAKKHGLKVIEDDAQAIGSEYKGRKAGTLGDVGCFSFYPTKNLGGAGDGGMVTTNDDDIFTMLKAYKEHGAGEAGAKTLELQEGIVESIDTAEKATELYNPYKYFNYVIGHNSRLDAMQAAVLSVKLKHLDEYNAKRAAIAKKYFDGLTDKIKLPQYDEDTKPCWHQFVIRSEHKSELCAFLSENGVGNGTFYPVPLHRQKAFNTGNSRISGDSLPVAEMISSQSVCLPVFPEMTDEQVQYVIETVNRFYEGK